jgi:hypothetical protein
MANGYSQIPSVSHWRYRSRHPKNSGSIPNWVMLKTHGSAEERNKGRQQPVPKATPEELPAPRTMHTGFGPGITFVHDLRGLRPVRSARR